MLLENELEGSKSTAMLLQENTDVMPKMFVQASRELEERDGSPILLINSTNGAAMYLP